MNTNKVKTYFRRDFIPLKRHSVKSATNLNGWRWPNERTTISADLCRKQKKKNVSQLVVTQMGQPNRASGLYLLLK